MIDKKILYKYSVKEDIVNAITHGIAAIFGYIGTLYLIYLTTLSGDTTQVIACAIYGTSITFLFTMSTLYHAIFIDKPRLIFKKLDHSSIFIMIAGTYVPFSVAIGTTMAYVILALIYLFSIIGIIIKVKYIGRYNKLATLLYILIGWMALLEINDILTNVDPYAIGFVVLGGITYTIGAIIYALSNFKYHHALWHIIVIIASIFNYIAIAKYII